MKLGPKKKHVGRQVSLFSGFKKFCVTYILQPTETIECIDMIVRESKQA